jgi:argininosuccinate lyase
MENTGRIARGLTPTARRILFGANANASIEADLEFATEVDRAHLVMLAECDIIERGRIRALLAEIESLRANNFAPLRERAAPRGLFLLYEDYLIEKLGAQTGGVLQTARSRNDLNATSLRLRLRGPFLGLLREALRMQAILLRRAARFAGVVMPAYTHYQAAVPITYGHYLAGIATAFGRDIAAFSQAGEGLDQCPLGACAVGGTSLPIDETRTASLLGFGEPVLNSIDAVASRDFILRLLASATIMGITLSRLATDLLLWTTAEFGFIWMPDQLVGSSSIMPQKRNPYLLEHVQGRSAAALGAFTAAATAMHAKPFTNSIAVGTESVGHVWRALKELTEAITLARLNVAAALPQPEAMLLRAVEGYTSATELANRLMVDGEMAFRTAHHAVGSVVTEAIANKLPLQQAASVKFVSAEQAVSLAGLDPASVARESIRGGGPGAHSLQACLSRLRVEWAAQASWRREREKKWNAARTALDHAVEDACAAVVPT